MNGSINWDLAKLRGQQELMKEIRKDLDWKEREINDKIKVLEKGLKESDLKMNKDEIGDIICQLEFILEIDGLGIEDGYLDSIDAIKSTIKILKELKE